MNTSPTTTIVESASTADISGTSVPVVPLRRSSRVSKEPPYLSDFVCSNTLQTYPIYQFCSLDRLNPDYKAFINQISTTYEPQFYHQAVPFPEWRETMAQEIKALEDSNTWSLVPLPDGKHCIDCRWMFKLKCKADGSVDRYKARLVAKGYAQQAGIDFSNTFSPVAKLTSVRVLLAVAAAKNWCLQQLDINNPFLNGELFEEVYIDLPQGYKTSTKGLVCKLNKSLYGLLQASRQWFCKFSSTLLQHGFTQSKNDYSLFTHGSGSSLVILLVYVDDIILAGPSSACVTRIQVPLQSLFKLKVLGSLKYFFRLGNC